MEVQFEKEHLHTFDPKCEMMLTIMSSLAQEESRSISENVRWGQRKSMEDGNIHLAYSRFLGYRKGSDGRPEIVEEEAKIIRRIFTLYLNGYSFSRIAETLTREGVLTPSGKKRWSTSTVNSILRNEKYKGEALLQKTFTADYLTKEVKKNTGELPLIRVKNSHEPIIPPEVFDRVQEMIKSGPVHRKRTYSKHPFAGKLICGDCGGVFGHKVWRVRSTGEHYDVWYCNHKFDGERRCRTSRLRESEVIAAFTRMLEEKGKEDTTYTDARWLEMVDRVVVLKSGQLTFYLKEGQVIRLKP